MMTRLQKMVDKVEDHHLPEAYLKFNDPKYRYKRPKQFRGSVLDATKPELDAIRKIAVPMDLTDHGRRDHNKKGRNSKQTSGWRRLLYEH